MRGPFFVADRNDESFDIAAIDVEEEMLDRELGSSCGIFSGEPIATAKRPFMPERARWVDEAASWRLKCIPYEDAERDKSAQAHH